jgi:hypothetical protein
MPAVGINRSYFLSLALAIAPLAASFLAFLGALEAEAVSVMDLQSFARSQSVATAAGGQAQLTNANPNIGGWYVLAAQGGGLQGEYHLEVASPQGVSLALSPTGLLIHSRAGSQICDIFDPNSRSFLGALEKSHVLFARLCDSNVWLRNGEGTNQVDSAAAARFLSRAPSGPADSSRAPAPAETSAAARSEVMPLNMEGTSPVVAGAWTPSRHRAGVYFSAIEPDQVAPAILSGDRVADPLGSAEGQTLVSLVALDLGHFTVAWSHGPLLPGVGSWSTMFPTRRAPTGAGPDGVESLLPLQTRAGVMNPAHLENFVASMAGGFQRFHGWMRGGGPYSGRYYGFIQEGVVLSSMSQGLVTLIVDRQGRVDIKPWDQADAANIANIRYARQNGVSIVDFRAGRSVPGDYVSAAKRFWGNWSGNAVHGALQTPRSGACIAENNGARYLVYAYFPSATPSAMARVFQAYQCRAAIHLDMNNPQWAYFGLLSNVGGKYLVEHPDRAMAAKDGLLQIGGRAIPVPRFIAHADMANPGDFFYFMSRDEAAP